MPGTCCIATMRILGEGCRALNGSNASKEGVMNFPIDFLRRKVCLECALVMCSHLCGLKFTSHNIQDTHACINVLPSCVCPHSTVVPSVVAAHQLSLESSLVEGSVLLTHQAPAIEGGWVGMRMCAGGWVGKQCVKCAGHALCVWAGVVLK